MTVIGRYFRLDLIKNKNKTKKQAKMFLPLFKPACIEIL